MIQHKRNAYSIIFEPARYRGSIALASIRVASIIANKLSSAARYRAVHRSAWYVPGGMYYMPRAAQ